MPLRVQTHQDETPKANFVLPLVLTEKKRIRFMYTNWKGKCRERTVVSEGIELVQNESYPQPTWCLRAICTDKNEIRTFSLAGIHPETIQQLEGII